MHQFLKKIKSNFGGALITAGTACASAYMGGPLMEAMIGGLLTNVNDYLDKKEEGRQLKSLLSKSRPGNMNPAIQGMMYEAVKLSIHHIGGTYDVGSPFRKRELKQTIKKLISAAEQAENEQLLTDPSLLQYLEEEPEPTEITLYLFDESLLPVINPHHPFPAFFQTKFPPTLQLCFGELLKKPENRNALVAYNRELMLAMQQNILDVMNNQQTLMQSHADLQQTLTASLQTLATKAATDDAGLLESALTDHLAPLREKVDLLVDQTGSILTGVDQLQQETKKQTDTLERIEQKLNHLTIQVKGQILGQPPLFPELILGRNVELSLIHQHFFHQNTYLLVLTGPDGLGKTTLAAEYLRRYLDKYHYLSWMPGGSTMEEALLSLATPLQLSFDPSTPSPERIELLINHFRTLPKPCLLVIDQANRPEDLDPYYDLLRSCPNFHILITTRLSSYQQATLLPLEPLKEEAARNLFQAYYPKHSPDEDARLNHLLETVGYNTLTIQLLAKKLADTNKIKTRYSLESLIEDLQEKGLSGIKTMDPGKGKVFQTDSVVETLYDLGEVNRSQQALLTVFALFPIEFIPFDTLEVLLPDFEKLEDTLLEIVHSGWLNFNEQQLAFQINPLIQDLVLTKNEHLLDDCQPVINGLIQLLSYDANTGHLLNISYEEGHTLARYGASLFNHLKDKKVHLALLCEHLGNFYQTTGNLHKALFYYKKETEGYTTLLEQQPNAVNHSYSLGIAYCKMGDVYRSLGQLKVALEQYDTFTKFLSNCHQVSPENTQYAHGLTVAFAKTGVAYQTLGNPIKAQAYFEQYARLADNMLKSDPQDITRQENLAVAHEKLGETSLSLGHPDKALVHFKEFFQTMERLYLANPDKVSFKTGLAISSSKMGEAHAQLGQYPEAFPYFERYHQLRKQLAESFPENISFQNGYAISLERMGDAYIDLGAYKEALSFFKQQESLLVQLLENFPEQLSFREGAAIVQGRLADVYLDLGLPDQALPCYQKYQQQRKALHDEYPDVAGFTKGLAIAHERLGDFYSSQGNSAKALVAYEKYIHLAENLYQTQPDMDLLKPSLAIGYEKLGVAYNKLGERQKALKAFERYTRYSKELHEAFPEDALYKSNLAIGYGNLGEISEALNLQEDAQLYFELYVNLNRALHHAHPTDPVHKNALALALWKLGNNVKQESVAEAKSYFQEAIKHWTELADAQPGMSRYRQFADRVRKDLDNLN